MLLSLACGTGLESIVTNNPTDNRAGGIIKPTWDVRPYPIGAMSNILHRLKELFHTIYREWRSVFLALTHNPNFSPLAGKNV